MLLADCKSRLNSVTLSVVLTFVAVGCGSNVRESLDSGQKVNAAVAAVGDAAMSEESFSAIFAGGSAPENREEYATCNFEVVGEPSVSGDEATAEVEVTTGVSDGSNDDRSSSKKPGEQEKRKVNWTLAKEAGEWKIKNAPLQ